MALQLVLGLLLEIVYKWTRISTIYISSVVGGSLFTTVFSPKSYAVGASAGVYGLLFSHLSTIILNWEGMEKKGLRLFLFLLYIVIDIGFSLKLSLDDNTNVRINNRMDEYHNKKINIFSSLDQLRGSYWRCHNWILGFNPGT